MARAIILVVDGFGVGSAPDAEAFGDVSANTFANMATAYHKEKNVAVNIPNLSAMGLVAACQQASCRQFPYKGGEPSKGAYGYAAEISTGKDTPSGHWEMMGVPVLFDWDYFSDKKNSFPADLLDKIYAKTGIKSILGNCHASGTQIIAKLGEQHVQSGVPICYTSADSVFQVAAHEQSFGLDKLYAYCEQVREVLDEQNVGRVIARPFVGTNASDFERTGNRRDYSVLPPAATVLDKMAKKGQVISIGKIADIFAHQGITHKSEATGLPALLDATLTQMDSSEDNSIIFTNLVNFDQDFGHRRDPVGFGEALEYFDVRLNDIFQQLRPDDLLLITSDHGCDPTWPGTDHTREYVPVLAYSQGLESICLGERSSFADLGQTLAELFKLDKMDYGQSFLSDIQIAQE